MRQSTRLLCLLGTALIALTAQAQKSDNSHYLAGAVPEEDGKVVFTREFSIPGMGKEEIYNRAQGWMAARLSAMFEESRIVLAEKDEGRIVGVANHELLFTQNAFSNDRSDFKYQMEVVVDDERCTLRVERLRYYYRQQKERYKAEGWITDDVALNKSKTKLVIGLAKWRKKTVDYIDDLTKSLSDALASVSTPGQAEEVAEVHSDGPIVITPKKAVVTNPVVELTPGDSSQGSPSPEAPTEAPTEEPTEEPAEPKDELVAQAESPEVPADKPDKPETPDETVDIGPAEGPSAPPEGLTTPPEGPAGPEAPAEEPGEASTGPAESPSAPTGYTEVSPDQLPTDVIQMGAGKLVVEISLGKDITVQITANAGGSLGKASGKAMAYVFLAPDQSYEMLEQAQAYRVNFFPTGQDKASVILECDKAPAPQPMEGQPRMYVGEIRRAFVSE